MKTKEKFYSMLNFYIRIFIQIFLYKYPTYIKRILQQYITPFVKKRNIKVYNFIRIEMKTAVKTYFIIR